MTTFNCVVFTMLQLLKACLIVPAALVLTACSSLQLGYHYAPSLIAYRANTYLNLNETQQALLDQELATFAAWHDESLPSYTTALNQWANRLSEPKPFTSQELLVIQTSIEQQLQTLGARAAIQLAPLIVTLGPQQLKQLQSKFDSNNTDYIADYLKNPDSPTNVKKRHARLIKRFEEWFGSLNSQQRQILTAVSDNRAPIVDAWFEERKLRQQALMQLLQSQRDAAPPQAQLAFEEYLQSLNSYRAPTLTEQRDALRLEWAQATANILNLASPEQKRHLQKKLRQYAQDFTALTPKKIAKN